MPHPQHDAHHGRTEFRRCLPALLRLAVIAVFTLASLWTIRMAFADYWFRRQSILDTGRAIRWMPGRADYYVGLASLHSASNPYAASDALRRALALNPYDAPSWIDLGLNAEYQGDFRHAEECLLRAAREDRQYLPRWTLANYYFRRNQLDRFWFWAAEAAGKIPGDPVPLFQLCRRVSEDDTLIDRLHIARPEIQAAWLAYLLSRNRLDLAGPAVAHLLRRTRAPDVPLLLATCDRYLVSGNTSAALEIWNQLAAAHRIPYPPLHPAAGTLLTNGSFQSSPISQAFDWRLPLVDGVSASIQEGGGLRLTFSGDQPETCELLAQIVPTLEARPHLLAFEFHSLDTPRISGLYWHITGSNGRRLVIDQPLDPAGSVTFVPPPDTSATRIALLYKRPSGTTRLQGSVVLRKVKLSPQTSPSLSATHDVARHPPE